MADTYILQKDLPGIPAGSRITWNQGYSKYLVLPEKYENHGEGFFFKEEYLKQNPEWFKKEEKQRIEVSGFRFVEEQVWWGHKDCVYILATRQRIPPEKFPAIKKAIEQVLND